MVSLNEYLIDGYKKIKKFVIEYPSIKRCTLPVNYDQ